MIVIGQSLLGHGAQTARLIARSPCPVAVAPYGHRFERAFAPRRIGVVGADPGAGEWLAAVQRLAPQAELITGRQADVDLLVIDRADDGLLRDAACPVLVVERAAAPLIVAPARR